MDFWRSVQWKNLSIELKENNALQFLSCCNPIICALNARAFCFPNLWVVQLGSIACTDTKWSLIEVCLLSYIHTYSWVSLL